MIATMSAFNAADWKKRRAILLGMSGADVDSVLWQREEYKDFCEAVFKKLHEEGYAPPQIR